MRVENIHEYFRNGVNAMAFGASALKEELIQKKDYTTIRENVSQIIKAVQKPIK